MSYQVFSPTQGTNGLRTGSYEGASVRLLIVISNEVIKI
jgi:hypothetical protein